MLKVQRSVASQAGEWPVPAAAVIGPSNPTGRSQSRLCENSRRNQPRARTTRQIASGSTNATSARVGEPLELRDDRVFTRPQSVLGTQISGQPGAEGPGRSWE